MTKLCIILATFCTFAVLVTGAPTHGVPNDEAENHAKKLAEAWTTIFEELPNQIIALLKTNDEVRRILEATPKLVKCITNIPKMINYFSIHPNSNIDDLHKEFPESTDEGANRALLEIFQIYGRDFMARYQEVSGLIQFLSKSAKINPEQLMIFNKPIWKNILSSKYFEEVVVNLLPNVFGDIFAAEDCRKILKSLAQSPKEGLETRKKIIDEAASNSLEKAEDDGNDLSKILKNYLKLSTSADTSEETSEEETSPEKKFKNELNILKSFGFNDEEANLKALEDGDIHVQLGHFFVST